MEAVGGRSIDVKVSISGAVEDEAGSGSLTFGPVQTHWRWQVQEGDVTFTVSVAPTIALTMRLQADTVGPVVVSGATTGVIGPSCSLATLPAPLDAHGGSG